ncbi:hypothetical protein [Kitasatospora sp. NPDC088346]|uniref:hypothetical protein n=1 Tax=Kitasatospora sp. NPDC088346 TaxID=3364073 RepID=UPI0038014D7F
MITALDVPGWEAFRTFHTRTAVDLQLRRSGVTVEVRLERCVSGRLRDTYPVGAHDVEVRIGAGCPEPMRPALLRALSDAVQEADPRCRRVVLAVPAGEPAGVAVAESAGFRYAVDVDLGDEELSLLVTEPDWGTSADNA